MTALRLPKQAYHKNDVKSYPTYKDFSLKYLSQNPYETKSIIHPAWYSKQLRTLRLMSYLKVASLSLIFPLAIVSFLPFNSFPWPAMVLCAASGVMALVAKRKISKLEDIVKESERIEFEGLRKALNRKFGNRNLIDQDNEKETARAILLQTEYQWSKGTQNYSLTWNDHRYEIYNTARLSKTEIEQSKHSEALSSSVAVWRDQVGEYVTAEHPKVRQALLELKAKAYALSNEKLSNERVYQIERILNDALTTVNIAKRLSAQTGKNEDAAALPVLNGLAEELSILQSDQAESIKQELETHINFIDSRKVK